MSVQLLVVSATFWEFEQWCRKSNTTVHDRRVRLVRAAQDARGYRDKAVLFLSYPRDMDAIEEQMLLTFNHLVTEWTPESWS